MSPYSGDPRWIEALFTSPCADCPAIIAKGQRAFYVPNGRKLYCAHCGEARARTSSAKSASSDDEPRVGRGRSLFLDRQRPDTIAYKGRTRPVRGADRS